MFKRSKTGLKNKKDIDISEGDVIKINNNLIGLIIYEPEMAGFLIEFSPFKSRYQNKFRINCDVVYLCENLGSIYEHPELKSKITGYDHSHKTKDMSFH